MIPAETIIGLLNAADHLRTAHQTLVRMPMSECHELEEFKSLLTAKAAWLVGLSRNALSQNLVEAQDGEFSPLVKRWLASDE